LELYQRQKAMQLLRSVCKTNGRIDTATLQTIRIGFVKTGRNAVSVARGEAPALAPLAENYFFLP
jgi:hypothetical protein